jgi:hypothetical protein
MKDKEAMKLALFALNIVKIHYTQSRHINEAITALKERLADPMREVQRLGQEKALQALHNENERLGLYKDAYAQQEPVENEFLQAITDPENQPSQFGTVTLDYHFEKIKKWEDLFERMSDKVLAQRTEPLIGCVNHDCAKCKEKT